MATVYTLESEHSDKLQYFDDKGLLWLIGEVLDLDAQYKTNKDVFELNSQQQTDLLRASIWWNDNRDLFLERMITYYGIGIEKWKYLKQLIDLRQFMTEKLRRDLYALVPVDMQEQRWVCRLKLLEKRGYSLTSQSKLVQNQYRACMDRTRARVDKSPYWLQDKFPQQVEKLTFTIEVKNVAGIDKPQKGQPEIVRLD